MSDADELDAKRPELEWAVVGVGLAQLRGLTDPVLVELRLHEPEREPRRHDRLDVDLAQQIRESADVVLVAVGQDDRTDPPPA